MQSIKVLQSVKVLAHAKVNIYLRIVGRRPNGYHDLEMVMVPLTLSDEILLVSIPSGIELTVDGLADPGMCGGKNLAWRAAKTIQEAAGVNFGVCMTLRKTIPIAAGLGGGSSDAAAVLMGLNQLWGLDWPVARLAALGASLGADCPFFCYGRPAFVEGIGDRVSPYDEFPNIAFLLINPGFSVSTPWAYKQWELRFNQSPELISKSCSPSPSMGEGSPAKRDGVRVNVHYGHPPPLPLPRLPDGQASRKGVLKVQIEGLTPKRSDARVPPASPSSGLAGEADRPLFQAVSDVVACLHNDLEEVTVSEYPEIAEMKGALTEVGAKGVLMSGSGPTVFGVFEDRGARDSAYRKLDPKGHWRVIVAESGDTILNSL